MKKNRFLFIVALLTATSIFAADVPRMPLKADPSATFDSIWVEYDVKENDVLGMRIHMSLSAYSMKGMDAYVAIYFEYNDDLAGFLKDKNKKFQSTDGDVAVYQSIKPAYDPAVYTDLQLFMPYSELDLEAGIYDLTMDAKLIYKQGGLIQWLTYYDFEYTKPGSPADVESADKADATFDSMWIDYNVTEGGKKGMRIHVKFTALNLQNVDCYVALYFEKKNGQKIDGITPEYRSKNGQLAVYKSIRPLYKEAVYSDLQLFMPYSEIKNLGKGKFDLKMEADIILKNGDMIKHLNDQEFWFEQ
ncbi:MAG TPA: hypothetical protein VGO58_14760 [Chitinophagaceae bacterium]|jgi:hypothetical protein|nr:hypothetical protein [Chitinophagaceae bacterium]